MVSYSVGESGLLFVEAEIFTAYLKDLLDDDSDRILQNELVRNPEKGAVMPDCGGLRKIRVENPGRGKGKHGGCRVIYLYIPEIDRIDLLAIYSKDKQDDLTTMQRKALKARAESARKQALAKRTARKDT
ncbi:MAG: hypothetical protein IT364_19455 [Candidatus Hydrogenedentes bacterium]|nr:hypothetical protein [Candidatus Hydrogenedentota bacterium]